MADRFLFGIKLEDPRPGNGETPWDNVRAEVELLRSRLGDYFFGMDVSVSMPDEIAPGHVLRWSTLVALLRLVDVKELDADA